MGLTGLYGGGWWLVVGDPSRKFAKDENENEIYFLKKTARTFWNPLQPPTPNRLDEFPAKAKVPIDRVLIHLLRTRPEPQSRHPSTDRHLTHSRPFEKGADVPTWNKVIRGRLFESLPQNLLEVVLRLGHLLGGRHNLWNVAHESRNVRLDQQQMNKCVWVRVDEVGYTLVSPSPS